MQPNKPEKIMVLQQGQSDCGVACLLSLINYYGGHETLENLRRISGTNITGTTLLGLYQAAQQTGFTAEGCEADIAALQAHGQPVILHVVIEEKQQHYVVCFGFIENEKGILFIIGDPAKGIYNLTATELEKIWVSRTCLTLFPNENFRKQAIIKTEKRKWLVQLIKEDMPLLSSAAVIGILIAVLGMAMAIFSQNLIDDILPKKNYSRFYAGLALVFILILAKEGMSVIRQIFLLRQSRAFNTRIIQHFYNHLLRLPKPFFDTRKTGELIARLNDTSRIQRVISQLAGTIVIDALVVVVTITFLFTYSWQAAILSICILPVYFFTIRSFNKRIIEFQRQVMIGYAGNESNYISTLQGIEPIKNYNKQELFTGSNKIIYNNYQEAIYKLGRLQIRLSFTANTIGVVFLISILLYTALQVFSKEMKTGELVAILSLCSSLLPCVANLALINIPINEAKIAFDRMFEFTAIKPEEERKHEDSLFNLNRLQVQNISFRFAGRSSLLENISFEVKKGEAIAILGENGSGKSTLSQILQRHYTIESGSILVNERASLYDLPLQTWRCVIGTVPQHIHIFNGTVAENIAFDDIINNPEQVLVFLKENGFSFFLDTLPQSIYTLVGEEGVNLSAGQRQMIGFARALYHQPQLLILDEATASMDRQSEKFVLDIIKKNKHKMAIIFISHKFSLVRSVCDRIYLLENKTISQKGKHEELLHSKNIYSDYWNDLVN